MRSYAIGDIHGQRALLRAAHARIAKDRENTGDAEAPIVHIGDLVDRGPDSAGVVEYLRNGIEGGAPWIVLKGNHDRMFTGFVTDPNYHDTGLRTGLFWLHPRLGGVATLASYGVADPGGRPVAAVHADAVAAVPAEHRAFLESRPAWHRRGEVVFVHAGIRPGVPMEDQVEDDLVWIRGPFLDDQRDHGFLVVHGHTAIDAPTHYGNRVNIDSSAGYGGPLTAIAIEGREVFLLTDEGRVPLRP
jgi:serine/threonine protein phosphatase 1